MSKHAEVRSLILSVAKTASTEGVRSSIFSARDLLVGNRGSSQSHDLQTLSSRNLGTILLMVFMPIIVFLAGRRSGLAWDFVPVFMYLYCKTELQCSKLVVWTISSSLDLWFPLLPHARFTLRMCSGRAPQEVVSWCKKWLCKRFDTSTYSNTIALSSNTTQWDFRWCQLVLPFTSMFALNVWNGNVHIWYLTLFVIITVEQLTD